MKGCWSFQDWLASKLQQPFMLIWTEKGERLDENGQGWENIYIPFYYKPRM